MNIEAKDGIKTTGDFVMQVFDLQGNLLSELNEKNLVVTLGKTNVAKLLGGDVAGKAISKIAFGTNGTAPVVGNTAITGSFVKPISAVTYPEVNKVRFGWTLEASEGNGISILELGLLNVDNVLFARKIRSEPIVKSSAVRLVGSWTITVI